jgi:hypothetical protein
MNDVCLYFSILIHKYTWLILGCGQLRNLWVLFGTTSTWFLLDIAFYSQNLFLPNILEGIGFNPSINLPAAKCVKAHNCPHYDLPVCLH